MTKKDFALFALHLSAQHAGLSTQWVNYITDEAENSGVDIADIYETKVNHLKSLIPLSADDIAVIEFMKQAKEDIQLEAEILLRRKIDIIGRGSAYYPKNLRQKLGNIAPPILYVIGNENLVLKRAISVVGPRNIYMRDKEYAEKIGFLCAKEKLVLVSGGADGVDSIAQNSVLKNGGESVTYLPQGFDKSYFVKNHKKYIDDGSLLCLCACRPDSIFTGAAALVRNKYIHSHGELSVVVRAEYKRGGSWSGAIDNISHRRTPMTVSDIPAPGNEALIQMGAGIMKYDEINEKDFSIIKKIYSIGAFCR
ncbi:MAG: DNA-processing protein DprA [Bacillota bacterium]|nr:DNA-processing protein DprA [Bacillota bacterium]